MKFHPKPTLATGHTTSTCLTAGRWSFIKYPLLWDFAQGDALGGTYHLPISVLLISLSIFSLVWLILSHAIGYVLERWQPVMPCQWYIDRSRENPSSWRYRVNILSFVRPKWVLSKQPTTAISRWPCIDKSWKNPQGHGCRARLSLDTAISVAAISHRLYIQYIIQCTIAHWEVRNYSKSDHHFRRL